MTKAEKKKIKEAIRLLHHEGRYFKGMDILAKLVGWKPVLPDFDNLETKEITPQFLAGLKDS